MGIVNIFCIFVFMKAIYKIENTITNDFYIGSAVNYVYRKWTHLKRLRENKHHNAILQNSWNKHGEFVFSFSIIEEISDKEQLVKREQYWIDTLNPRYNICRIAGSPLGIKHSNEARLHMSIAQLGKSLEERGHKKDCNCPICKRKTGINSPRYIQREERYCLCGCGTSFICMITSNKKYISGHNKPQLGRHRTKQQIENHKISLRLYHEKKHNIL